MDNSVEYKKNKSRSSLLMAVVSLLLVAGLFVFNKFVMKPGEADELSLAGILKENGLQSIAANGAQPKRIDTGVFDDPRFQRLRKYEFRVNAYEDLDLGRDNPFLGPEEES